MSCGVSARRTLCAPTDELVYDGACGMGDGIKRTRIRLKGYDYSKAGYYFITVCTKGMRKLFWNANVAAHSVRPYGDGISF